MIECPFFRGKITQRERGNTRFGRVSFLNNKIHYSPSPSGRRGHGFSIEGMRAVFSISEDDIIKAK